MSFVPHHSHAPGASLPPAPRFPCRPAPRAGGGGCWTQSWAAGSFCRWRGTASSFSGSRWTWRRRGGAAIGGLVGDAIAPVAGYSVGGLVGYWVGGLLGWWLIGLVGGWVG